MKQQVILFLYTYVFIFGFITIKSQGFADLKISKKIIYFSPEIYPNLNEIQPSTNEAFFETVSDEMAHDQYKKLLRIETSLAFDSANVASIKEFCLNNNADFAIVPKVKYFKVGIGKYVFSNQVIISMKLYDAFGNFITESQYDTFKKNGRILGSAENSIKIGTKGAMKRIFKNYDKIIFANNQ